MLIQVSKSKRFGYAQFLIPMKDERNSERFGSNSWVYYKDGKPHGKIPTSVLPTLMHLFGGEEAIRKAGYRKHWDIFQDLQTGEFTFGNKPSFSRGTEHERAMASNMPTVDPKELEML